MPDGRGMRSPWVDQLRVGDPPRPLTGDLVTDVVVVGAGIAGAATAFFVLRDTDRSVVLLERGRIGHGATGHNAGQLATYFERPLTDLVEQYGVALAMAAQRDLDGVWELLELMVDELGLDHPYERFTGNMGMFNHHQVRVHLRHSVLRRDHGLHVPGLLVSAAAPFVHDLEPEFDGLYEVVPDVRIREVLGPGAERYWAVLRSPIGAANGALLVQHIVDHLLRTQPDRFVFADHSRVERVTLGDDSVVVATVDGHRVTAGDVVMCTNGFTDHLVDTADGRRFESASTRALTGTVGFMHGIVESGRREPDAYSFIRNEHIGDDTSAYIYLTRRTWGTEEMLVVVGGPETTLADASTYEADAPFPDALVDEFERDVLPLAYPQHRPGDPVTHRWHGLMGYTSNQLRLIGRDPHHGRLLYNLGCNGVGFMPSIHGGRKIAAVLAGIPQPPSLFDPPA